MPFKSEKQRRYLWANKPDVARKFVKDTPMKKQSMISKIAVELLVGGEADGKPHSAYDPEQLAEGIEEELEHTGNIREAEEIAKDHLEESPDYYRAHEKMEDELEAGEPEEDSQEKLASTLRRLLRR